MATETSNIAMPTTAGMAHGDINEMSMSMTDMIMAFFYSSRTPLFSEAWTPSSTGNYAGTCIFLVLLSCILRAMLALKPSLEAGFWRRDVARDAEGDQSSTSQEAQHKSSLAQGMDQVGEDVRIRWAGWSVSSAASRAVYEALIVCVGYLLMIAVMTMNIGYFLSVLAGAWLGAFIAGGLASETSTLHHPMGTHG